MKISKNNEIKEDNIGSTTENVPLNNVLVQCNCAIAVHATIPIVKIYFIEIYAISFTSVNYRHI